MHLSGATSRDFGAVSVADRRHAAKNPKAYFYEKPITIEDHQNSRWIAEPLRLLDCCQETDGAVAIVVTSAERAKDLKQRPAVIEAASQGASPDQYTMVSYYRPELGLPAGSGLSLRWLMLACHVSARSKTRTCVDMNGKVPGPTACYVAKACNRRAKF